jgi:hypothetical protein
MLLIRLGFDICRKVHTLEDQGSASSYRTNNRGKQWPFYARTKIL